MTEYDYSPEAYERFLANQNRIAKWVDHTEQHRPQFQSAFDSTPQSHRSHKDSSRRRKPSLYIHPPPPSESSSESSDDSIPPMPMSAPGIMYAAPAQPRYPGPPIAPAPAPLLSPPPVMPVVYPNTQRSPYHYFPPTNHHHHRSPSHTVRSPHAYYGMGPSPQVSPAYPHPHQFFYPPPNQNPHAHPGYVIMPPSNPPHQPVVYVRA